MDKNSKMKTKMVLRFPRNPLKFMKKSPQMKGENDGEPGLFVILF